MPLVPAWRVDKSFDYEVPETLVGKLAPGSLVRIPFGHRKVRGIVVAVGGFPVEEEEELEVVAALVVDPPLGGPGMVRLLDGVSRRYATPRGRTFARVVPPRVRVRPSTGGVIAPLEPARVLRYDGGAELIEALRAGRAGAWTWQALPNEDRGALIAELVAAAASQDRASLVAVPEVRYGSEVLDSLKRLQPALERIDSSTSDTERAKAWLGLAAGAPLGAGGRATVFAPAPRPALIVLDEEHHRTYKEDRSPRYDARVVALERARLEGSTCVFVSATPSMEASWAAHTGARRWVRPSRADSRAARPIVELVEPADPGLAPGLHRAVRRTLSEGGRVGLLVPRSGYARSLWCATCRRSVRCPRCEAGMIFERGRRAVRCPRCGLERGAPDSCPSCGGLELRSLGAGSERLAEQLTRMFPRATVARVDPDVLQDLDAAPDTSTADIYVTTWIGTKVALRPDVSLVGVLDADMLIRRPDFRSSELAYQAFAEMSEWAGPASEGGHVVIQCSEPGHHSIQAVVRGDHRFFVEREAEHRRELGYPPFAELVKVRAMGDRAGDLLEQVAGIARSHDARLLGPVPVREGADGGLEVMLKCPAAAPVAEALRDILPGVPSGSRLRIDVDPR